MALGIYKVTDPTWDIENPWDKYVGFVCFARDKEEARAMLPSPLVDIGEEWNQTDDIQVEYLGEAKVAAPGVILTDFRAG